MIDFVNTGNCFLTLFSKPVSVLKLKMASSIRQLRNNTAAKHVTWVTCQTWHQARENTWVRFWLVWKTACLLWLIRARWTNVFFLFPGCDWFWVGILVECNKILDACDVASHDRGNHFFTISFPGEEPIFQSLGKFMIFFSYLSMASSLTIVTRTRGKILSAVTLP